MCAPCHGAKRAPGNWEKSEAAGLVGCVRRCRVIWGRMTDCSAK